MAEMSSFAPTSPVAPSPLKIWLRAVRVFSFTASVTPVLIGSAFALVAGEFSPLLFLLIVVASAANCRRA